MSFIDFGSFPIGGNLAILAAAAVMVWFAGTRVERYTDRIADRTGMGKAFAGFMLLAVATSLPEVATTITGSLIENAPLVVNNLTGGIAMQTAILALADYRLAKGALTYFTPQFSLLLQGVALVLLLGLAVAMLGVGDLLTVGSLGMGSAIIAIAYGILSYGTYKLGGHPRWHRAESPGSSEGEPAANEAPEAVEALQGTDATGALSSPPTDSTQREAVPPPSKTENGARAQAGLSKKDQHSEAQKKEADDRLSLAMLCFYFGLGALVILLGGWTVAQIGDTLTQQTGLNASFVGATLVAITTSLPEVSTTLAAVKRGNLEMAVSNIFGSNAFTIALLFVGDLFYKGSLLAAAPPQAIFTASMGIVVTCVYLWGLLEWKDRTIARIGFDSAIVLMIYIGGLVILYFMK